MEASSWIAIVDMIEVTSDDTDSDEQMATNRISESAPQRERVTGEGGSAWPAVAGETAEAQAQAQEATK